MNRTQKIIVSITSLFLVLFIITGLTFAYFMTNIFDNTNEKSISVTTANLALKYDDGNGLLTSSQKIRPNMTLSTKTFTVTNTGNSKIENYGVILEDLKITYDMTFKKEDNSVVESGTLTYFEYPETFELILTCKEYITSEYNTLSNPTPLGDCSGYNGSLPTTNDILLTNEIEDNITHEYELTLTYLEGGFDQSADMNKTFEAKVDIINMIGTMDIEGTLSYASTNDYVQINSEPKKAYPNKEGKYKVVGLPIDEHTVQVYNTSSSTPKSTKEIIVQKGDVARVSGTTITVNDTSRLSTININSKTSTYTIPNSVKKISGDAYSLVNVGDYVFYNYTGSTYTTPTVDSGKSVYPETQTFNSATGGDMTVVNNQWRVINIENGIVELIPTDLAKVTGKLKMSGLNGYLNAAETLNNMCAALYSGQHGTARSIESEDINKKVQYDGTKIATTGAKDYMEIEEGTTIGEIENSTGIRIAGPRISPTGETFENTIIDYYQYRLIYYKDDHPLIRDNIKVHLGEVGQAKGTELFKNIYYRLFAYRANTNAETGNYWVADTVNDAILYTTPDSEGPQVKYRVRFLNGIGPNLGGRELYDSSGNVVEDEYKVMPIVALNKGLKVQKHSEVSDAGGTHQRWSILNQ